MRLGRAPALAFLGVVALLIVAAAPAAADHVYSHRYVIVGRVIDDLGKPAMGWVASATFSGVTPAGLCSLPPPPQPETDGNGDFFLCYHVHGINGGTVTVSGPAFTETFNLDLNLRKTVVHVRLAQWSTHDANAVAAFPTHYTVRGRVWQSQPGAVLEGVSVNGVALTSEPVSVEVAYNSGSQRTAQATTNGYGDYSTVISLGAKLSDGTVLATSHGVRTVITTVDNEFMVSESDVGIPAPPSPVVDFLVNYYWAILVPVAGITGVWFLLSRARPRRHGRDVSRIPGIGRAKAQRLRDAGAGTIDRLAEADPKGLAAATGLSVKETKRLTRKAREFVGGQAVADKET